MNTNIYIGIIILCLSTMVLGAPLNQSNLCEFGKYRCRNDQPQACLSDGNWHNITAQPCKYKCENLNPYSLNLEYYLSACVIPEEPSILEKINEKPSLIEDIYDKYSLFIFQLTTLIFFIVYFKSRRQMERK